MATLVVQAHPLDDSYNAALFRCVLAGLDRDGCDHRCVRLGDREWATSAQLSDVERLVLVYPTWWGGLPASLLDWVQHMLAEDAFASVLRLEVVTTHGSSQLVNLVQGAWGRRYVQRHLAGSCAPGVTFAWHALYKIDRCSPEQLEGFLAETETRFAGAGAGALPAA